MIREFERIFREMPIGAVLLTRQYDIQLVNEAFGGFVGYAPAELEGRSIFDFIDVHDRAELMGELDDLQAGERTYVGVETRYRRKDGTLVWGYPVWMLHPTPSEEERCDALLVLVVDITDRRHMELRMRKSEHMDSLGMLAGSVAHEFNNVLTIIKAFVELLEADPQTPQTVSESVDRIRAATARGEKMTRQLLDFGRVEEAGAERIDVNAFVETSADMFGWILPPTVEVELKLSESEPAAVTNRGRLQRLLMDRVLSARDAMQGEGELTLQTGIVASTDDEFPAFESVEEGDYAVLRILDTGSGVPAESIPQLLESFVTVKQPKGGAVEVRAIHGVFAHEEGFICIESRRDGGTRFELYLPAA